MRGPLHVVGALLLAIALCVGLEFVRQGLCLRGRAEATCWAEGLSLTSVTPDEHYVVCSTSGHDVLVFSIPTPPVTP